jgi:uncharacterized membrane protein
MSDLPREAEAFLRSLEKCLSALPQEERREVVAEIRSHLADRAAEGSAGLLAPFGRPEEYAATFLEERSLAGALAAGSSWSLGRALLSGAGRLGWWYAVAVLWLVQVLGASFLALAVVKVLLPGSVGLYIWPGGFVLGSRTADSPAAAEVLGWWTVPAFLLLGVAAIWSARWTLRTLALWRLDRLRARQAA